MQLAICLVLNFANISNFCDFVSSTLVNTPVKNKTALTIAQTDFFDHKNAFYDHGFTIEGIVLCI